MLKMIMNTLESQYLEALKGRKITARGNALGLSATQIVLSHVRPSKKAMKLHGAKQKRLEICEKKCRILNDEYRNEEKSRSRSFQQRNALSA